MLHNKSVQEGASYFKLSGQFVVWLGADSVKFSSHFHWSGPELFVKLNASFSRNRKILDYPSESTCFHNKSVQEGLATSTFRAVCSMVRCRFCENFFKPFSLVRARVIVKLNAFFSRNRKILDYPSESTCFTISLSQEGASYFKLSGQL
jgi:hypothetical protein